MIWVNFEGKLAGGLVSAQVRNRLLHDLFEDQVNTRMYGMKNFAGLEYDRDAGATYTWRPVNEYYDYQIPIPAPPGAPPAGYVAVLAQRVWSDFKVQNLEVNVIRFPLCDTCGNGGGCGGCDPCGCNTNYTGCDTCGCDDCWTSNFSNSAVSLGPGISDVTVTPVSFSSLRSASAKDCTNDFEAL